MSWFESKKSILARKQKDRELIKEELKREIQADLEEKHRIEDERIAEELKLAKSQNEPFVNIVGIIPDPKNGIKIELDWNDAFINYLKENGYTGADDNIIIQKYILELTAEISDDMLGANGNEYE